MGANAGPDIVSDGLVLALDAADNNSFRGEPTVNVINGGANRANVVTVPISVGNHASISKSTSLTSYSSDRPNVLRYTSTNNTGYSMLNQQFSIQNQSGTTYTYSFEYKQLAGASNALQYSVVYKDGYKSPDSVTAASNISNTQIDLEDGWKRWILTYTSTYTGYNYVRFNLFTGGHLGTGDGDFDFYFDNFMLQEGSKRTRFVDGTRGTTVATGGGWADISGNDNHGEILNGTTTSNDESVLGAIDFDGSNDYIDLGTPSTLTSIGASNFAIECIIKPDTLSTGWTGLVYLGRFGQSNGHLGFNPSNNVSGGTGDGSTWQTLQTSYTLSTGTWYHLVMVRVDNTIKFYANGSVIGNYSHSHTPSTATEYLEVGNGSAGEYFAGKIASVKIYNQALTASEILQNYNSLKTRFGL